MGGLERFADGVPVTEGVEVLRAPRFAQMWRLETSHGPLLAGAVVVASGFQNVPRRSDFAEAIWPESEQIHVADYRRPQSAPDGHEPQADPADEPARASTACRAPGRVVGAPWLTHRASSNLYGMVADADRIAGLFAEVAAAA